MGRWRLSSLVRRCSVVLPLLYNNSSSSTSSFCSSSLNPLNAISLSSLKTLTTTARFSPPFLTPLFFSSSSSSSSRSFSSSSGPPNIIAIETEEEFTSCLNKVQDDSLPAIFYFTAVWCGPCRVVSPVIEELSQKYPHVKTYKVDIDKEGLENALSKLHIYSVPTFHFFKDGNKATEIIGADVAKLKHTMEKLYK